MNGTIYMPVGEVCSSISDTYREKKNMVTLINTSDVLEGRVLNHERVPNSNLKGQFKKTFQRDDILYSEIRPQNRRFAYVDFSPIDYIASTKLMVIRAKKDVISPKYLYYFLKNSSTVAELQLLAETRSGTFPQITFSEVANLTIPVPSLAVQEVIVQTMQCLEDKIICNEQTNDNLQQQAQAIYSSMFIDNPDPAWSHGHLSDLITVKYGKDHKKLADGIYPVYGSGGIMRYVERPLYNKESVLIPRKGTLNNVMYVNQPFWSVDTMFYTEMKLPNVAKFVYHFVKAKDLASMNAGSAVPSMTTDILNAMEVVIPSASALEEFESLVAPMYEAMEANDVQSKALSQIRDTLLPKLMSGEIDVSDVQL